MAEELGSAYIELSAKIPSKSEVGKSVDDMKKLIADAIKSGEKVDPGIASFFTGGGVSGGAGAAMRSAAAQSGSGAMGLMAQMKAAGERQLAESKKSMFTGGGAHGMAAQMQALGFAQMEDAKKSPVTGEGAPGIAEKMKAMGFAQMEAQRRANEEVSKFGGFLRGANSVLAFAGIGGIGAATIGSVFNRIQQRADYGTSMSNPLQAFQKEQVERDISGSIGRRFATLTGGDLQREQNQRAAFADPNSLSSRQARQTAAFMNFLKNLNPLNWLESFEASRAKERGYTGVGAGMNPMLGHKMSSDDAFDMMMQATLQTPIGPKMTAEEQQITRMQETTKALEDFAAQIRETMRTMYPQAQMP